MRINEFLSNKAGVNDPEEAMRRMAKTYMDLATFKNQATEMFSSEDDPAQFMQTKRFSQRNGF